MKAILFITILSAFSQIAFGQIDFTPYPGSIVHCPNQLKRYTASSTNCGTITWTITNGVILTSQNSEVTTSTGQFVDVRWNNVTSLGVLKVSVTCGSGESAVTYTEDKDFVIRSLSGVVPQNIRSLATPLPICSTNGFDIFVDEVIVPNTGPFTSINAYYAEGYEWSVPAGWSKLVNGNRVTITPDNGCSTGSVKVRGYISSCGTSDPATWFYSAWSADLILRTITNPVISANSQSSYTLQCGSTTSVRFNATDYPSCNGESYTWVFPAGWRASGNTPSPVTTTDPFIDLVPLTTPANAAIVTGGVQVTANLGCGNYQSTGFPIGYSNPPLSTPNFTTTTSQLLCNAASASASIITVSGGDTYTWYSDQTSGMKINNVLNSYNNPVTIIGSSVTMKAPDLATGAGFAGYIYVKANRSNGCAGSAVRSKKIWLGAADQVSSIGIGLDNVGPFYVCVGQTYQFNGFDVNNIPAVTTYNWQAYGNTITSGQGNITSNIRINRANQYLSLQARNTCGNKAYKDIFLNYSYACGCGGFECFSVYPNPAQSSQQVTAELIQDNSTSTTSRYSNSELQIEIVDNKQKVVYSGKSNIDRVVLPENSLKPGTYILKARKDGKTEERTIIIK
jgi:hypothetical protein